MPEADPAPAMEETAVANGAAADVSAPEKKDVANKEEAPEINDAAAANKNTEEQNKGLENGTEDPSDGDDKMVEAESAKAGDGDALDVKQVDSNDAKMDGAQNADAKEHNNSRTADGEDAKMTEAEAGGTEVKKDEHKDDKDENTNVDQQDDLKEQDKGGSVDGEDAKMTEAEAGDTEVKNDEHKDDKDENTNVDQQDDLKEQDKGGSADGEDAKMTEAEAGDTEVKKDDHKDDKDENTSVDQQDDLKEQEKNGLADQEENKEKETGATEKQEEEEAEEKHSADEKEENAVDEKANANEEKLEKDGASDQGKDNEVTEEKDTESDKKVEDNEETPKNKKARSARDRSQGKDKKQDGSKSREAKSLLSTPSPYGTDRPQRERKTVERLVEVIEKEPNSNFVIEKGRGTPLKDIPSVAHRISRKKPADLKFLHSILFGRKGKTVDFKGHILQFSGFVWHESDEKQRAKAKEKLDKCVKDMLLDLCWLLAIPVPKSNIRKEDIVSKLLDFIAEPHGDSALSDDQGSNPRKRKSGGASGSKSLDNTPNKSRKKFGDDTAAGKRRKKSLKYDTDEEEDDESMKSDSEENKHEDTDEAADEQEDDYDSGKEKASKRSSEIKESSGKRKIDTGSSHKTGPRTISKSPVKKSSSKEKESPDDSAKVFSRKRKSTSKGALVSEKEIKDKKSAGKKVTKGKGESAEVDLPSKDELRKTITGILKKVDFNTATFSDILKKLDNHYKMDLTPKKEAIKLMIQDELTKLSEEADEDEYEKEEAEKKHKQHRAKEVEA
ncbi:hypothetical protein ACP70R_024901 [Stipagrostis hirtigluma subsp. patula]